MIWWNNAKLRRSLRHATALEIVGGGSYDHRNRNEVLARTTDPLKLVQAVSALRLTGSSRTERATTCHLAFAFLDGDTVLQVIECLLPGRVRGEALPAEPVWLDDEQKLTEFLIIMASAPAKESLESGQPVHQVAADLRSDFGFSPFSAVRVLRSVGISLADGKIAVDRTLNDVERHNTEMLRDAAVAAFEVDDTVPQGDQNNG